MLGTRIALILAGALLTGVLAPAPPANATQILLWRFDDRGAGLPATDVPARTIVSASATLSLDPDGSRFSAVVELGGVPERDTDAGLRIAIGVLTGDGCRTDWSTMVRTASPSGPGEREDATIRFEAEFPQQPATGSQCGSVSVVGDDGTVLDQLVDSMAEQAIADPGGYAHIVHVRTSRAVPGRWSAVWVQIRYRGSDADGLRLRGTGRGLDVRRAIRHRQPLVSGDVVWLPLRVRLRRDVARDLTIEVRPYGHLAFVHSEMRTVRIRPRR